MFNYKKMFYLFGESLNSLARFFVAPKVRLLAGDGAVLGDLTAGTGLQFDSLAVLIFETLVAVALLLQVVHAGVFRVAEKFEKIRIDNCHFQQTSL